ncbi:MAG: hypothetical protein RLZZ116_616 [Planctomycetota bacterium]|jgi:type II secretory pathway pseudopilin PulG
MPWINTISKRVRRGLSIVELLVAIGVVIAISAIVIPWSAGWLGGRELDNAEDNLAMQMMMARAAAREEGRPVEVVAEFDGVSSRVKARWMEAGDDAGFARSGPRDEAGQDAPDDPDSAIDANWASVKLPHGVRVALGLAADREASAKQPVDDAELLPSARGETIAIFLPDGTVFFAPVFMLRTDAGSLRAMKVDRATGVPQAVEQAPAPSVEDVERPEFEGFDLDEPLEP